MRENPASRKTGFFNRTYFFFFSCFSALFSFRVFVGFFFSSFFTSLDFDIKSSLGF